MNTTIPMFIGNGTYDCRLGLSHAYEIERKCGAPIGEVMARLLKGRFVGTDDSGLDIGIPLEAGFKIDDVVEVIRQGLRGGGRGTVDGQPVVVTDFLATQIVNNYVLAEPLLNGWRIASGIILAWVEGYEPPVKKKARPKTDQLSQKPRRRTATSPESRTASKSASRKPKPTS